MLWYFANYLCWKLQVHKSDILNSNFWNLRRPRLLIFLINLNCNSFHVCYLILQSMQVKHCSYGTVLWSQVGKLSNNFASHYILHLILCDNYIFNFNYTLLQTCGYHFCDWLPHISDFDSEKFYALATVILPGSFYVYTNFGQCL